MPPLRIQLPDHRVVSCAPDAIKGTVFGRDASCDVVLNDPRVSARHLSIFASDPTGASWFVSDLNSRHGVTINSIRIAPGAPTPIVEGDRIGAGPVVLHVGVSKAKRAAYATLIDGPAGHVVPRSSVSLGVAELQHIARISAARTRAELFDELLSCCLAVTGYARAVVADTGGDAQSVDLLAARAVDPGAQAVTTISRSLVTTALRGGVAVHDLRSGAAAVSIVQSLIHHACCVGLGSVESGGATLVLYLDSRSSEASPHAGAPEIVAALAIVASACLDRLNAESIKRRQELLRGELEQARAVQQQLTPPAVGTLLSGRLRYNLIAIPGSIIAGDMADVFPLREHQAVVLVGDVMGKGAGAGMVMASVQAQLAQGLRDGVDLESLLADVNRGMVERFGAVLLSLWIGVVDVERGVVRYVDAGHGMTFRRGSDGSIVALSDGGGSILGVDEGARYEVSESLFAPGDRLVLFTDGLAEQPDPSGNQLGLERIRACMQSCPASADQAEAIRQLLSTHAGRETQRDDVTVLVAEVGAGT